MNKVTYEQVSKEVDALAAAYREVGDGYEYAATTGTLHSILACLISGEISRKDAFESLQAAVRRANFKI